MAHKALKIITVNLENIMKIASISKFIDIIKKLEHDPDFIYAFRGHSDSEKYKLSPSVFRKLGILKKEDYLFKELLTHNPEEFRDCHYALEYLVKMQHYGLPTRLLDLTLNPLIALYFAVSENETELGEVIVLKIPKNEIRYYDSDTVSVLANISKMSIDFEYNKLEGIYDVKKRTDDFNEQDYINILHHQIGFEKPHFKKSIFPDDIDQVICVKTKLSNPRIVNQAGLFLLFGCGESKLDIPEINNDWVRFDDDMERILVKNKKKILKELELFGITNAYVYPELDKYAKKLVSDVFDK
jgi:hypothetical protein